ncbi:MAG TPA: AAA family ATPase [Nocardioides sp.]|uniref:AAA family ATPase n=1 Tax=Nocardioides sp. TaxID=35761 RepID=UPI002B5550B3|nr:AAA family ATPase [Nocardioides sp.]HTW16728.1 AAA family ATPase [Nocardioides sp.]
MLPDASDDGDLAESRTEAFGYVYCGLRRIAAAEGPGASQDEYTDAAHDGHENADTAPEHSSTARQEPAAADSDATAPSTSRYKLKNPDEIDAEFLRALHDVRRRDDADRDAVTKALQLLEREPSFGRVGIQPSMWAADQGLAVEQIGHLSTGHKIVLNIVVQLAAHLRRRSLVLLDEPETHLHPPLLAALMKSVQQLLDHYDSFAVMATHSPVVLQEIPAVNVRVLSRFGDDAEVSSPHIETFGENLSTVTRAAFSLDSSATDYQGTLAELAASNTVEEIDALFPLGLSDQARALVLRLKRATR